MFYFTAFGDVCIAIAAYAAGAFTWPKLHQWFIGAEAYAAKLRAKAFSIVAAARS